MTDIKDISWPEPMANSLRVANDRIAELEQELAEERESNEAFSRRIEELAATLEHVNNRYKEQGKQAMRLRQAIQNTLDTGMERYIRDVL